MLQSQGLRASSGGGDYIPPEPGQFDSLIGGYFAGHMVYYYYSTYNYTPPPQVYQLWLSPKSMEESKLNTSSGLSNYNYNELETNDQAFGYLNNSSGLRTFGLFPRPWEEDQWYIPALYELQQAFRYLRPSNFRFPQDGVSSGTNPTYTWYRNFDAVPRWYPEDGGSSNLDPYGTGYPPDPFLVNNPDFQFSGSQAFEGDGVYLTSTIIDQTSSPVNADQIGRAVMHMYDGQILNPYYVKDYYDTGSSLYYLNFSAYTYSNGIRYEDNPLIYKRYVKRRNISVSVDYLNDYYETYEPVRFTYFSGATRGRFRAKWNYDFNFWNI